jgi:hypothetical protein
MQTTARLISDISYGHKRQDLCFPSLSFLAQYISAKRHTFIVAKHEAESHEVALHKALSSAIIMHTVGYSLHRLQ